MSQLHFDQLKLIEPRLSSFEDAEIRDKNGKLLGWHSTALSLDGEALGSGLGSEREVSLRIAIAETAERALFRALRSSPDATKFQLDAFPSACGFAAGFDDERTMLRAVSEAVERWAWSKWIDEHYRMPEISMAQEVFSNLGRFFFEQFEKVRGFRRIFSIDIPGYKKIELQMCVALAYSQQGVFPGSRVCPVEEDPWQHALIEAWRHRVIFEGQENVPPKSDLVSGRIAFFGRNQRLADQAVVAGQVDHWPTPSLLLLRKLPASAPFFLWRGLCSNYLGWHEGDEKRFVF
ncbi:hypothetical protein WDW86_05570 [Bdellovibrionota bacterium FG-2]